MEFSCTAQQAHDCVTVTLAGDVDLAIYSRFQSEADAWVGKQMDLVLDCSGVTFMDSMGLRVLVSLRQQVTDAGRDFAVANPSTPVTRVLELAGLISLFNVTSADPQMSANPAE